MDWGVHPETAARWAAADALPHNQGNAQLEAWIQGEYQAAVDRGEIDPNDRGTLPQFLARYGVTPEKGGGRFLYNKFMNGGLQARPRMGGATAPGGGGAAAASSPWARPAAGGAPGSPWAMPPAGGGAASPWGGFTPQPSATPSMFGAPAFGERTPGWGNWGV